MGDGRRSPALTGCGRRRRERGRNLTRKRLEPLVCLTPGSLPCRRRPPRPPTRRRPTATRDRPPSQRPSTTSFGRGDELALKSPPARLTLREGRAVSGLELQRVSRRRRHPETLVDVDEDGDS